MIMKCGNCGEISEKWQYVRLMGSMVLKGGHGSAFMISKLGLLPKVWSQRQSSVTLMYKEGLDRL
ncbi:hypothetical protein U0070_021627 [Myodes glareolus]|uniref:Uncharacterized protein n=1 Tax=Myodes glareolus TaxID=447135 RepID=A0AAW0I0U0_MYOGA